MSIFDIELPLPELTPVEQEIQDLALNQLRRSSANAEGIDDIYLTSLRLKRDGAGGLMRMTDEEFMTSGQFTQAEVQNIENLQLQLTRQKRALEGTLPVSEGLRQQEEDQFRELREANARLGNIITGDDPATAVAGSTSGAQSLGEFNRTFALAKDEERRSEIQAGQANIGNTFGLVSDLLERDRAGVAGVPGIASPALDPFLDQQGLIAQRGRDIANLEGQLGSGLLQAGTNVFGEGISNVFNKFLKKIF